MAEQPQPKKPETFDQLEQELDKDALSPAVVSAERQDDSLPPDPRGASPGASRPVAVRVPEPDPINDTDLQEAASATETTEDPNDTRPIGSNGLHLEADPNAPRPRFWRRKRFWFSVVFLLILALALAWFIRPSRLFIVNSLGLRGEIKVTTLTQPEAGQQAGILKKVTVEINGAPWQTDDHGVLTAKLPYANTTVVAKKQGYESVERQIMIDFDPFFYLLGGRQKDESDRNMQLQLKAVGLPVKFQAKDWLTGEPITGGNFGVGEVVAKPDDKGFVSLTIPATDDKTVAVKSLFGGKYIDKEFELPLDGAQPVLEFVPLGKDYFVSNRGGGLAVYSSDLDGSNVTEVVPASPLETAAVNIAVSPSGKYGILASTRAGSRDAQGTLLQQLLVVDLSNKKLTAVDEGQWFNFVDWSGDTLVYSVGERKPGAAANSQRLASVDAPANKRADLSTAASFSALRVAYGNVMYQANAQAGTAAAANNPEQRVVPARGGAEKSLGAKVQQISQIDPERFVFQGGDGAWQEYNINKSQIKPASAPASPSRVYVAGTTADGQNRLAVDRVDGKLALIARNVGNGSEKQLYSAAGIRGPVRITEDIIIFRVADGAQTADYAVSIRGGTPKKIADVTLPADPIAHAPGYISLF